MRISKDIELMQALNKEENLIMETFKFWRASQLFFATSF